MPVKIKALHVRPKGIVKCLYDITYGKMFSVHGGSKLFPSMFLKWKIVLLIFGAFMTSRQCVTTQRNVEVPLGLAALATVGGSSIVMLVRYMQAIQEAGGVRAEYSKKLTENIVACNKNVKKQEAEFAEQLRTVSEELVKTKEECKMKKDKCDNEKKILNDEKICLTDFANGIILDQKRTIQQLLEELQENKKNILDVKNELKSHQRQIIDLENTKSKLRSTEADLENTKSKLSSTEADVRDLHVKYSSIQSKISGNSRDIIAFHAILSSDVNKANHGTILKFTKVITNDGKAYDPNTGNFIAPVDGVYKFDWSLLVSKDKAALVCATVNGNVIQMTGIRNQSDPSAMASGSMIVQLKRKDEVHLQACGDTADLMNGVSSFGGHMI